MSEEHDTQFEPHESEVFGSFTLKGEEYHFCNHETALAKLLVDDICFLNTRRYVEIEYDEKAKKWDYDRTPDGIREETIVVFVNCNDIWAWACAEAEPVTTKELPELYRMHTADKKWGSLKWACKKRQMQPQSPIRRDMKKEGAWCGLMESLPPNPDDKTSRFEVKTT